MGAAYGCQLRGPRSPVPGSQGAGGGGKALRRVPLSRWFLSLAGFTLAFLGGGAGWGEGQYLAVFVDGRILPIAGVNVVTESRIELDLGEGGSLEIPLARLDRVIEAAVEEQPEPVAKPPCEPGFVAENLPEGTPFAAEIAAASQVADLHPWLVAAVVEAESRFDPMAVSRVGARGLMQLMPAVWQDFGIADPHEPRANLAAGCRHLRAQLDRFGDLTLALAAYNAGAAVVARNSGVPPYRETRRYIRHVLSRFCPDGQ